MTAIAVVALVVAAAVLMGVKTTKFERNQRRLLKLKTFLRVPQHTKQLPKFLLLNMALPVATVEK